MNLPARVVDLHTHLFNARYMPLESVIASAMNKEESKLADYVAKLLYALAVLPMRTPRTWARRSTCRSCPRTSSTWSGSGRSPAAD